MSSTKGGELVIIPAPGMGHLVSIIQLAKLLLKTNESISVTILIINLPMHSSKINGCIDTQSRDNPYPSRLTFITLPTLSNPPEISSFNFYIAFIDLHKPLVKQAILDRVKAGFPKPAAFVLDMFCCSMVDIANELSVPPYAFFTSGAAFLNIIYYAESLAEDHGLSACDLGKRINDLGFMEYVPGFKNPVTSKVIPDAFKDEFGGGKILEFARRFRQMKGILVNSYVELEPLCFQSLINGQYKKTPPVYPVGPILDLKNGCKSNNEEKETVIEWLDGQPESSVVFLCFGSVGSFGEEQVKEIANGLDRSGHRFLWALRKPQPGGPSVNELFLDALPEGFIDRTISRGKIIAWAPQVEILAHPAVGGFVSHCGWNSTMESLWFGVPIGAWPMYAEQQLNAFELVKDLKLAVEIRLDYSMNRVLGTAEFVVNATEIEKGVKKLMSIDEKMKENVKKVSDQGRKALEEGGSSYYSLVRFIEDVLVNID